MPIDVNPQGMVMVDTYLEYCDQAGYMPQPPCLTYESQQYTGSSCLTTEIDSITDLHI